MIDDIDERGGGGVGRINQSENLPVNPNQGARRNNN